MQSSHVTGELARLPTTAGYRCLAFGFDLVPGLVAEREPYVYAVAMPRRDYRRRQKHRGRLVTRQ